MEIDSAFVDIFSRYPKLRDKYDINQLPVHNSQTHGNDSGKYKKNGNKRSTCRLLSSGHKVHFCEDIVYDSTESRKTLKPKVSAVQNCDSDDHFDCDRWIDKNDVECVHYESHEGRRSCCQNSSVPYYREFSSNPPSKINFQSQLSVKERLALNSKNLHSMLYDKNPFKPKYMGKENQPKGSLVNNRQRSLESCRNLFSSDCNDAQRIKKISSPHSSQDINLESPSDSAVDSVSIQSISSTDRQHCQYKSSKTKSLSELNDELGVVGCNTDVAVGGSNRVYRENVLYTNYEECDNLAQSDNDQLTDDACIWKIQKILDSAEVTQKESDVDSGIIRSPKTKVGKRKSARIRNMNEEDIDDTDPSLGIPDVTEDVVIHRQPKRKIKIHIVGCSRSTTPTCPKSRESDSYSSVIQRSSPLDVYNVPHIDSLSTSHHISDKSLHRSFPTSTELSDRIQATLNCTEKASGKSPLSTEFESGKLSVPTRLRKRETLTKYKNLLNKKEEHDASWDSGLIHCGEDSDAIESDSDADARMAYNPRHNRVTFPGIDAHLEDRRNVKSNNLHSVYDDSDSSSVDDLSITFRPSSDQVVNNQTALDEFDLQMGQPSNLNFNDLHTKNPMNSATSNLRNNTAINSHNSNSHKSSPESHCVPCASRHMEHNGTHTTKSRYADQQSFLTAIPTAHSVESIHFDDKAINSGKSSCDSQSNKKRFANSPKSLTSINSISDISDDNNSICSFDSGSVDSDRVPSTHMNPNFLSKKSASYTMLATYDREEFKSELSSFLSKPSKNISSDNSEKSIGNHSSVYDTTLLSDDEWWLSGTTKSKNKKTLFKKLFGKKKGQYNPASENIQFMKATNIHLHRSLPNLNHQSPLEHSSQGLQNSSNTATIHNESNRKGPVERQINKTQGKKKTETRKGQYRKHSSSSIDVMQSGINHGRHNSYTSGEISLNSYNSLEHGNFDASCSRLNSQASVTRNTHPSTPTKNTHEIADENCAETSRVMENTFEDSSHHRTKTFEDSSYHRAKCVILPPFQFDENPQTNSQIVDNHSSENHIPDSHGDEGKSHGHIVSKQSPCVNKKITENSEINLESCPVNKIVAGEDEKHCSKEISKKDGDKDVDIESCHPLAINTRFGSYGSDSTDLTIVTPISTMSKWDESSLFVNKSQDDEENDETLCSSNEQTLFDNLDSSSLLVQENINCDLSSRATEINKECLSSISIHDNAMNKGPPLSSGYADIKDLKIGRVEENVNQEKGEITHSIDTETEKVDSNLHTSSEQLINDDRKLGLPGRSKTMLINPYATCNLIGQMESKSEAYPGIVEDKFQNPSKEEKCETDKETCSNEDPPYAKINKVFKDAGRISGLPPKHVSSSIPNIIASPEANRESPPLPIRRYQSSADLTSSEPIDKTSKSSELHSKGKKKHFFGKSKFKVKRKAMSMDGGLDEVGLELSSHSNGHLNDMESKLSDNNPTNNEDEEAMKVKKHSTFRSILSFFKKSKHNKGERTLSNNQPLSKAKKQQWKSAQCLDVIEKPQEFRTIGKLMDVHPDGTRTVALINPPDAPMGFYIGHKPDSEGLFVSRFHDGTTDKLFAGLISKGDEILEINGCNARHLNVDEGHRLLSCDLSAMTSAKFRSVPSLLAPNMCEELKGKAYFKAFLT